MGYQLTQHLLEVWKVAKWDERILKTFSFAGKGREYPEQAPVSQLYFITIKINLKFISKMLIICIKYYLIFNISCYYKIILLTISGIQRV